MSLKAFHIIFVLLSTLLSVGFAMWAVGQYLDEDAAGYLVVAFAALVVAAGLVGYGVWFLRKLKDIRFL